MNYSYKNKFLSPDPITKTPDPPDVLGADGKREWRRLVGLLVEERILTKFDRQSILVAALEWERYISCIRVIKKEGETWQGKNGYVQIRPESTQANKSFTSYTKMLQRFGQDPESRQKIRVGEQNQKKQNPFEEI